MTQQLGAQDAQFLYLQGGSTMTHVMGVYIYDPSTAPGGKVRCAGATTETSIAGWPAAVIRENDSAERGRDGGRSL